MRMTKEQIMEVERLIEQAQKGLAHYQTNSFTETEDEHLAAVSSMLCDAAYHIDITK